MKASLSYLLALSALTVGCAADSSPSDADSEDVQHVATAYLGLTVIDCQAEATECVRSGAKRWFSTTLTCSTKLTACLADASLQAADQVVASADDVLSCGLSSVDCVAGAQRLGDVVACEGAVETCVVSTVDDLTGIQLPTTHEAVTVVTGAVGDIAVTGVETVVAVAEHGGELVGTVAEVGVGVVGEVAQTGVEVIGEVAQTGVEVVGVAAEAGVHVVGTAVDVGTELTSTAVETVATVADATLQTAGAVVDGAVETVDTVVDCNREARTCWRDTRDLFGCQKSYRACLRR